MAIGPILVNSANNKNTTKSNKNKLDLPSYNYNDIYKQLYKSYSSGGGGYTPVKTDISGLLAAYEQEAASQREVAQRNYDLATQQAREKYNLTESSAAKQRETTRSALLTSLKRFQEQNARDVEDQKQAYLTSQANLEAARESANRQSRISNAARGLAGSGLQQLEQMQNLINQGQQISELAGENQTVRENLARALLENQEDYDTNIAKAEDLYNETIKNAQAEQKSSLDTLLNNYTNTLSGIASALESQRETAIANNETAYTNAVNQARAQAAAARSSAASNARTYANYFINNASDITESLQDNLRSVQNMSDKEFKAYKKQLAANDNVDYKLYKNSTKTQIMQLLADNAKNNLATLYSDPNLSLNYNTRNSVLGNINTLLDYYTTWDMPVKTTSTKKASTTIPGYIKPGSKIMF